MTHLGLPPLTLPFCLVSWLLLVVVMVTNHPALAHVEGAAPIPANACLAGLLSGLVRGFGQVFLCRSLATAVLVLAGVTAASPPAMGMDPVAVSLGPGSYNGVLTAIALGGTFYAASLMSVVIALLAAAGSALVTPALPGALGTAQLPVLILPFVLSTMATMLALRRALPSLLPVALHSVLIPEEHRQRLIVARSLLKDFRQQLRRAVAGEQRAALLPLAEPARRQQLQELFRSLDRDGNGRL